MDITKYFIAIWACDSEGNYDGDYVEIEKDIEALRYVSGYENALSNAEKIQKLLLKYNYDDVLLEVWEVDDEDEDENEVIESYTLIGKVWN